MTPNTFRAALAAVALTGLAACTDDRNINAATGALAGAAVGSQVGEGRGNTAATLAGAAIGATVGANQTPRQPQQCTYRNTRTGQTYIADCP